MPFNYTGSYDPEQDKGGALMPVDEYEFVIVEAEETHSKNTRAPMWKFVLQPTAEKYNRRKLWHYIMLDNEWTEQNVGRMLASVGADTTKSIGVEARHFLGKTCRAKIKHEEYNGEMNEKIARLLPKAAPASTPRELYSEPVQEDRPAREMSTRDDSAALDVPF